MAEKRLPDNAQIKDVTTKDILTFCSAHFSDIVSYQTFTFLIFTFYYSVMGINVNLITLGFILWSFWNSINDPLLGSLSDRTSTRWGRRRPYIMLGTIPLALMMFLLFSPPGIPGEGETASFVYFIIIIMVFEGVYTMFSINVTSSFPELFITTEQRIRANNIRQIISIVGLIVAFIGPTLFIPDLTDPQYFPQYQEVGIVIAVIVVVGGFIFIKWGPRERAEFQKDFEKSPGVIQSIVTCVKSKAFRRYIPAEVANWFVFGMLPTIIPLYAKFVLGVEGFLTGVLLGLAFICGAGFMNLWKVVVAKLGNRKAWLISMAVWIATLAPTMFITDLIGGLITFAIMGLGLSGSLYIIDLVVSDIIDEDEVNTGIRREASYYGVNALFLRLSTIFVFLAISSVFNSVGWTVFEPENVTDDVILGLRLLMFVFPAIALAIGIVAIWSYPLHGSVREEMIKKLEVIHSEKQQQTQSS